MGYEQRSGNFIDPWGDVYLIAIDGDYDNSIPHSQARLP